MSNWQPSASMQALTARAALNQSIRAFFAARGVLEVEVPLLARATVTDSHIDSITAVVSEQPAFLQTSPEFFMKRLLSAGSGPIYSLAKAFRNGEAGRKHNPEFTMLEWYQPGWDEQRLMGEVAGLLSELLLQLQDEPIRISYRALFQQYLQLDPHIASLNELRVLAQQHCQIEWDDDNKDTWLDVLMTHVIEPQLQADYDDRLVFVYDYPASQAALAKVEHDDQDTLVAKRFEAYVQGVELANGYWELTDAQEQQRRFDADCQQRAQLDLPVYHQDQHLLSALASGMPDAAGVALGVDRVLMLATGAASISDVISFDISRC